MKILLAGSGMNDLYGKLLTRYYAVDYIADGDQALQSALSTPYSCLILTDACGDVNTLIRNLRRAGNHTPVLCLLHLGGAQERILALSSGADDCMTMPGSHDELLARTAALLRRRDSYAPDTLSAFGLTLDPAQSRMSCGEVSLPLTRMEYAIMQLLMSSPEVSFTARDILDRAWTSDSAAGVNTIWVYISRLRRKLEELSAPAVIRSRRNLGYSICPA